VLSQSRNKVLVSNISPFCTHICMSYKNRIHISCFGYCLIVSGYIIFIETVTNNKTDNIYMKSKINCYSLVDLLSDMFPYYDIVSLNWMYWIYGLGYLDVMDPLVRETVGFVRPVKVLTLPGTRTNIKWSIKPKQLMDYANDISNHIYLYIC
jgi:hypothetical protein